MNLATIVVLAILAALLALAVRAIVRGHDGESCSGCSNEGCSGKAGAKPDVCPTAARAMADVEARLGPAGKPGDGAAR